METITYETWDTDRAAATTFVGGGLFYHPGARFVIKNISKTRALLLLGRFCGPEYWSDPDTPGTQKYIHHMCLLPGEERHVQSDTMVFMVRADGEAPFVDWCVSLTSPPSVPWYSEYTYPDGRKVTVGVRPLADGKRLFVAADTIPLARLGDSVPASIHRALLGQLEPEERFV